MIPTELRINELKSFIMTIICFIMTITLVFMLGQILYEQVYIINLTDLTMEEISNPDNNCTYSGNIICCAKLNKCTSAGGGSSEYRETCSPGYIPLFTGEQIIIVKKSMFCADKQKGIKKMVINNDTD